MKTLELEPDEIRALKLVLNDLLHGNDIQTGCKDTNITKRLETIDKKLETIHEKWPDDEKSSEFEKDEMEQTWKENQKFFHEHEEEFMKQYEGLYIAVHKGEILGTASQIGPLATEIYEKYGNIPFYAEIPGYKKIEIINLPIIR